MLSTLGAAKLLARTRKKYAGNDDLGQRDAILELY
eukprot:SAG11_NODE_35449_length_266_cov_1.203593_2_plen_34_part_01